MEYQATSKYVRASTRKVRLIADVVRSLRPQDAIARLTLMPHAASVPVVKVIQSALANAAQKQANTATLTFKTIEVMGGPVMKRFRAVSRGQAHGYKKRMTHIRVVLTDEGVKKE